MTEDRPLSPGERALLAELLTRGEGTSALLAQLEAARVVARCDCGCPSIEIAVADAAGADPPMSGVVVSAEALSPEGVPVDVIVFAQAGRIWRLEIGVYHPDAVVTLPTALAWVA
jgi:hypothetical protein